MEALSPLQVSEGRKTKLGLRGRVGPQRHLLSVLPLQYDPGHIVGAVFHGMRVLAVAAVELHATDGADIVGFFEGDDQFFAVGGTGALDGLRQYMQRIEGGERSMVGCGAEAFDVSVNERLWRRVQGGLGFLQSARPPPPRLQMSRCRLRRRWCLSRKSPKSPAPNS